MTKTSLPNDMRIACCLTCTLGASMRDCKSCPFNIGIVYKGLELLKQAESGSGHKVSSSGHLFLNAVHEFDNCSACK